MPDMPSLLGQGIRDARRQEDVTARRIAQSYREAYKIVEEQLKTLHTTVKGEDNPLLAAQRYSRLSNMLKTFDKEYARITGQSIRLTGNQSANNFINGYRRVEWAANQELRTGTGIGFGVVPIDAVRASVYSEQSGRNYIVTFKDNARQRIQRTRAEITRMIATGQNWDTTARNLADQFERGYNDALRVVRTETARNYTQGTVAGFERAEALGINITRTWVATLDQNTRPEHAALDGTDADEDGLFWINGESAEGPGLFPDPAQSINCRCAVSARIAGLKPTLRRENVDEKAIIPYQTWTEWAEGKGWSESIGWPQVSKV